jgi:hypothetical protein
MKRKFLAAAALTLFATSVLGASPSVKPSPDTPVSVTNTSANPVPVSVQGGLSVSGNVNVTNPVLSVDALNDLLNEPYFVSQSFAFSSADSQLQANFDIPNGKRLIVENITARAAFDATSNAVLEFAYVGQSGQQTGYLSLTAQGDIPGFGGTTYWFVGTHSVKLRLDAVTGSTNELVFFLQRGPVGGTWNVSVAGYLVPLP